jgi:hypothetical protein
MFSLSVDVTGVDGLANGDYNQRILKLNILRPLYEVRDKGSC